MKPRLVHFGLLLINTNFVKNQAHSLGFISFTTNMLQRNMFHSPFTNRLGKGWHCDGNNGLVIPNLQHCNISLQVVVVRQKLKYIAI